MLISSIRFLRGPNPFPQCVSWSGCMLLLRFREEHAPRCTDYFAGLASHVGDTCSTFVTSNTSPVRAPVIFTV